MQVTSPLDRSMIVRAILTGGLVAGVLDAIDAVIAFKLVLGLDPIPIYQFVASGALGPQAFEAGLATALVGLGFHFVIAFAAAAVFTLASVRWRALLDRPVVTGAAFGVVVYLVMTHVVIPLSKIPPSPSSLPLVVNGVVGHALLVGLPIALAARRYLASPTGSAPRPA
jgi:hypothetical protein